MKMQNHISNLEERLNKIHFGKAHEGLLDDIKVIAYGEKVPLSSVANIVPHKKNELQVKIFDKKLLPQIERSLFELEMNLKKYKDSIIVDIPKLNP